MKDLYGAFGLLAVMFIAGVVVAVWAGFLIAVGMKVAQWIL